MAAITPPLELSDRVPISAPVLAAMVTIAGGDPSRMLAPNGVDWEELYNAICRNNLIGLAYYYVSSNPGLAVLPESFRDAVKKSYLMRALRMAVSNRAIRAVLAALNAAEISYLVIKGPSAACIYPNPSLRIYNDLDLVVREKDWASVTSLLHSVGYTLLEGEPAPPPKLIPQAVAHETKFISADGTFRVEVHYEDVLAAGLAARDVDGFWQRSVQMEFEGVAFKSLGLEDQLLQLCAHAHQHSYLRLNWFSDIALLLRRRGAEIHWNRLKGVIQVEEAHVQVYYSLLFVEKLFGVRAPEYFLNGIRPNAFRRLMHDRYLPPEKVVTFAPLRPVYFHFYFLPLYQRLLPDLLVMGRRREKVAYLLRLLAPPRDWLCHYYQLDRQRWIYHHYLLHPFRLMGVYIRETALLLFGKTPR